MKRLVINAARVTLVKAIGYTKHNSCTGDQCCRADRFLTWRTSVLQTCFSNNHIYCHKRVDSYGVFTLSETENDFSSETDKMLKSSQSHWLLSAISSVLLQKSFSVSLSVKTPLSTRQVLDSDLNESCTVMMFRFLCLCH